MTTPTSTSSNVIAQLEQHKARVQQLSARQARAQVQLETARESFAKAQLAAQTQFGTSDLDKLQELLVQKNRENELMVAQFVEALNTFEAQLVRVEQALADPVALEAFLQDLGGAEAVVSAPAGAVREPVTMSKDIEFDGDDI